MIKKKDFDLILIDFSWVYNRYYYVAIQKSTEENLENELYNMLDSFLTLVTESYWNANILVFLDASTKKTRGYSLNKNYKQNRDMGAKKEVYKYLRNIVTKLNKNLPITCSFLKGIEKEADEVIAYHVKKYSSSYNILIYSGDKDLLQLTAFPNTYVSDKFSNGTFLVKTDKEIFEKFKNSKGEDFTRVSENKKDILKYRTLKGDSSDNLPPAFPRIKDKEIVDIIKNYWINEETLTKDMMNTIISNIKKNNESLAEKLEAGRSTWITNYQIMNLFNIDKVTLSRLEK